MEARMSAFSQMLLDSPRNCWLALTEDKTKIVASGSTPEEAEANAKRDGVDDPLLIWSPEQWTPRVF